jgi:hypothetical protein
MNIVYAVLLGIVLLVASYLIGGTYTIVSVSNNTAVGTFVMNRYTGRMWLCNVNVCRDLPNQGQASAN